MLGCLCREQAATPGVYLHNPVNEFYKSIRSCLRNDHWYQKLVWSYARVHSVKDQVRQAKADFPLVLLVPG
jgi:hypothetical protein